MTIFIAIGVLLVVALVMFFMFRTKPKKPEKTIVAITPPSGGGIAETYIEFANPTIEVTGLNVTLPEDYGEWTYNDGTKKTAELTRMVLELRQGDEVLGNIVYERDTADPPLADWYIEHEEGQSPKEFTVALRDDLINYDSSLTSPLKAFVSFTNDPEFEANPVIRFTPSINAPERFQTGTGAITGGGITGGSASYIGAPTNYTTRTNTTMIGEYEKHRVKDAEGNNILLTGYTSVDECKSKCNELQDCKYIYASDIHRICAFYSDSVDLISGNNFTSTIYEKQ